MSTASRAAGPRGLALARWLLPFFCLYVSFGASLGFLGGGAPLILRVRGVELAQIGLLQVVNLPLGLTFLWAALLDRARLPLLPHRVAWIVLMQGLGVALLAVLAGAENAPLAWLFCLGVAICFCVATMDISLEALIVETVSPADRPTVSSAKFAGASIGGILGNGVILGSYDRLGWTVAVAIVALIGAAALLPVLRYPEARLRRPQAISGDSGGGLERLRALLSRVVVLGLYFAALYLVSGANGLALIDLGLPLGTVGIVSGGLSAFINLVMALASGILMRRVGTVRLITAFAAGLVLATGLLLTAMATGAPHLGLGATVLAYLCSSGLGVPVFNMLYRWSQGPRAATDYAILFGAAFFASMPARVAAPVLASSVGWPAYFALAILAYVAAFWVLRTAIARTVGLDAGTPASAS